MLTYRLIRGERVVEMKVKDLIEKLKQFDENQEVMLGEYQRYGSDFAYDIGKLQIGKLEPMYSKCDNSKYLFIILGQQYGTIKDDDDFEDDESDDDADFRDIDG